MTQYIIAYLGGKQPESPEAGKAQFAKWQAWIEGLGEAVVNPGTPLKQSRTLGSDGVKEGGPLSGFAVIEAGSIEEAVDMAKSDPFLEMGSVQVAEMIQMK